MLMILVGCVILDIPFEGVVTNINRRYPRDNSGISLPQMSCEGYMNELSITCHGYRLNEAKPLACVGGGENKTLNIGHNLDLFILSIIFKGKSD